MINSKAIWPVVKLAEEREQTALLALNQAAGQLREEQQRFYLRPDGTVWTVSDTGKPGDFRDARPPAAPRKAEAR